MPELAPEQGFLVMAREMSARAGSTDVEVAGSHAIYVSQPAAVAELIQTAVNATTPALISA
jgi:hypothetical protein